MNKTMQRDFEDSLKDEWDLSTRPDGQYAFPTLRELYRAWLTKHHLTDNEPSEE